MERVSLRAVEPMEEEEEEEEEEVIFKCVM